MAAERGISFKADEDENSAYSNPEAWTENLRIFPYKMAQIQPVSK